MDWWHKFLEQIPETYRKQTVGALYGAVFGIVMLVFGVWKILFVAVCAGIGYFIVSQIGQEKGAIASICESLNERFRR